MNNLMGFGNPVLSPGLKLTPELAGRYGGISDLLYRPDQDYGSISDLLYRPDRDKAEVQLLGQAPSFEIPQGQGRSTDYSIYNDPRMPGARKLRRKLEGILGLPRYEFPQV